MEVKQESADLNENTKPKFQNLEDVKLNGFVVSTYHKNFIDMIENFEVRDDDIWVCSFPKTGKSI